MNEISVKITFMGHMNATFHSSSFMCAKAVFSTYRYWTNVCQNPFFYCCNFIWLIKWYEHIWHLGLLFILFAKIDRLQNYNFTHCHKFLFCIEPFVQIYSQKFEPVIIWVYFTLLQYNMIWHNLFPISNRSKYRLSQSSLAMCLQTLKL